MTPQREKAIEIFDKFYDIPVNWDTAKDCARIVVEEIIADYKSYRVANYLTLEHAIELVKYWEEVLNEIDKL